MYDIPQNKSMFDILGITTWHQMGYLGEGMKIAEFEISYPSPIFDGKLHDPFNISSASNIDGHGTVVLHLMHQVCPVADLYTLPNGICADSVSCTGSLIAQSLPYIKQIGIDVCNASFIGVNNLQLNEAFMESGSIITCAAGNAGQEFNPFAIGEACISVGSVDLNMEKSYYSLTGQQLDCMCFGTWSYPVASNPSYISVEQGTSFAAPVVAGMICLVQQFFKQKTGKKLTQAQMQLFIKDNCKDLGDIGHDIQYGDGFFTLPNPDIININKYIGSDNVIIKMQIGNKNYTVDGVNKVMDQPPIIDSVTGRTLSPVRVVAEELGANVEWDGTTKTITITK